MLDRAADAFERFDRVQTLQLLMTMTKQYAGIAMIALMAALSGDIHAQQILVLDLGNQKAGASATQSVQPGTYKVQISSIVPPLEYRVSVIARNVVTDPLAVPSVAAVLAAKAAAAAIAADPCSAVSAAHLSLVTAYNGSSEASVRNAVIEANNVKPVAACTSQEAALNNFAHQSRIDWEPEVILAAGQELVVTVVRAATTTPTVEPEKTWEKTYTTGPRGQWRTTYGFASVFTRLGSASGAFAKRNEYALQTAGEKTTISESMDRGAADLVPSVLFHFMPTQKETSRTAWGPNAGISFDGTDPLLMLGFGATYQQNINLSIGYMGRKEQVLLSKYEPGQEVSADLDAKQLTESKLRLRPYLMLTFRFSSSPFTKSTTPAKEKPIEPGND